MRQGWVMAMLGVAVGLGAAGEALAFSASYDQKTTHGQEVMRSKVTIKDERFRVEANVQGQEAIIIRNAGGTYMVMPNEGMAMNMTALNASQQPVQGAEDYTQYLQQRQAERIGSETIDGRACDIYRFFDPDVGGQTTAWVWTEQMFPIRLDINGADGRILVEISNVQLNVSAPESAFQLPSGVQVMDMGAFMNMN